MEITMPQDVLNLESDIPRDEEFIETLAEDFSQDSKDSSDFRSIGDVLKQMAFRIWSNPPLNMNGE